MRVRTPCDPSKMICLWNNFHELAAKLGSAAPDEPLYLLKAPSAFAAHGDTIHRPKSYAGKVVYEGELGIVIGRRCSYVSEAEAPDHIFGYSCINDVTAADLIGKTPAFPQWTRAKSFDRFRCIRTRDCDRARSRCCGCGRCSTARNGKTTRSAT